MRFFENLWFCYEYSRIIKHKSRVLSPHSTSLSDGNLVDGLPSARHTEAVGGPMGCFGQRLSMVEALGNEDLRKDVIGSRLEVLFMFGFVYICFC